MNKELRELEAILKRNSDNPDDIDIEDEVNHYFLFDNIFNKDDLERAWSLFPEGEIIRDRLSVVEQKTQTIAGWGYRIPGATNPGVDSEQFLKLVENHIKALRPIILDGDYNDDIRAFIDTGFTVELAASNESIPSPTDNDLFGTLYEALQEFKIDYFPFNKEHYEVLYNWAIYLTKCDEVAAYLLWPCLQGVEEFEPDLFDYGVKLWKLGCRDRFWIKDGDIASQTVCFRPPWLD